MASSSVEILKGKRLSGSSAIEATRFGLDVAGTGSGTNLGAGPGVVRGATGGEFDATVAELGESDGGGVGGTEAADRRAPGGIGGGAVGEPAVCGGAAASSNAGATGSNRMAAWTRDSLPPLTRIPSSRP